MKVCPDCAEELGDEVVECTLCGRDTTVEPEWRRTPQPVAEPSAEQIIRTSEARVSEPEVGRSRMNLAVASFLLTMAVGILGTAASFPPELAVLVFIVTIGLGLKGMQETRASGSSQSGFGFAAAAVLLSLVGVIGYGRDLIG